LSDASVSETVLAGIEAPPQATRTEARPAVIEMVHFIVPLLVVLDIVAGRGSKRRSRA
jgi:hypothetical protein